MKLIVHRACPTHLLLAFFPPNKAFNIKPPGNGFYLLVSPRICSCREQLARRSIKEISSFMDFLNLLTVLDSGNIWINILVLKWYIITYSCVLFLYHYLQLKLHTFSLSLVPPKTECGCLHGGVLENGRTRNPLTLWILLVCTYMCWCTYWVTLGVFSWGTLQQQPQQQQQQQQQLSLVQIIHQGFDDQQTSIL